jgi:hypothetical protein
VELPTTRANLYPSRWQRERIQRAARICRCIERGQAGDKRTIHKMLVRFAWVWKDRHYTCDPSRRIRFSYPTLRSLYYAWKNGGGIPATLALHYWGGNRKASMDQVIELSKLCLAPETKSFSAAYRKLATPGATESAYRHATPGRLRAAVAALLAHRRHEQVLERAARRILVGVAK